MKRPRVFISYSWKDQETAKQLDAELRLHDLDTWIDIEKIAVGDRISDKVEQGLTGSEYYVVLLSESARNSPWVRAELSKAFDLSNKKKITIVPLLLDDAEVPLELRGLLYIDFRKSISEGMKRVTEFFTSQFSKISELEPRTILRKSMTRQRTNDAHARRLSANLNSGTYAFTYLIS